MTYANLLFSMTMSANKDIVVFFFGKAALRRYQQQDLKLFFWEIVVKLLRN